MMNISLMEILGENDSFTTSTDELFGTPNSTVVMTSAATQTTDLKGYITFLILISCTGIIGNLLVILAVVIHKKLHVIQNVFIVNLAVADFLVTAIVTPFAVVGVIDKGAFFLRVPGLCEFIATVTVTGCTCSICSIASVSLNRYIAICHRLSYPKIYNKRTLPLMVVGTWGYAFLIDLPNYVGWSDHIFDPRTYTCNYDYSYNLIYTRYYLVFFGFGIPLCVLCFSYFRVYRLALTSTRRMRQHADNPLAIKMYSGLKSADRRLLKTLAVICITFLLMWTPYALMVVLDQGDIFWAFVPAISLAFMNSSVNFIIYATNDTFREAYIAIFKRILCCKCTEIKPQQQRVNTVELTSSTN